jgi:NADPH-ferrihemoprotein reductase
MGRHEFNYKKDVFNARRTPLELICEMNIRLSLEELLYQVAKMKPRYYSISSSDLAHPNKIYLTYRPVRYVNGRGALREGTCTRFLSDLVPVVMDDTENKVTLYPHVVAGIRSNPKFRLPSDPNIPIILIAGGCGVAPIRAFVEERMWLASHHDDPSDDDSQKCGNIHLFLGFRSPMDEVYRSMVDRARASGVITDANISYSTGCTEPGQNCALVSQVLAQHGELVYDLLDKKSAHIYLCGGARLFGAAIEGAIVSIIQVQGNMSSQDAREYLRHLIRDGRFLEDLAD